MKIASTMSGNPKVTGTIKKKVISLSLALVLIMTLMPAFSLPAYAADYRNT